MSVVGDVLSALGLTGDIAKAVARAELDPTSANVQEVVNAYARNGQIPPTKIMAHLIERNETVYPNDTYRALAFPWILAGLAALWFFLRR